MQHEINVFETFKVEAIPVPYTPDRKLVLPATPIPDMPIEQAQRVHRAQYDAILTDFKPRDFRGAIVFVVMLWLILAIGCMAILIFLAAGGNL